MPRQGWSTVSIRTEDYDFFYSHYEDNKLHYRKKGITSFAGFMAKAVFDLLKENETELAEIANTN